VNRKLSMLAGTALTVLAFAPGMAAHAQAANGLGEVVVTATKTGATNLQKTPLSVDVISGGDLKKEGIESFRDLQMELPSVKLLTNGTNPRVYIRGVGGYNANDGDVSLYIDGVYLARDTAATQATFNDLDRVEVLEGPQGTTFGRNATGGAINFISKAPSDHFTFNNTLSVGNYALIDEAASVSGPLADNIQASLAFTKFQHNGYEHNVDPGVGDGDNANRLGLRGQIRWEITPSITNTVRADYAYTNENWMTGQVPLANVASGKIPGVSAGCSTVFTGNNACGFNYAPLFESTVGNLGVIDFGRLPLNEEIAYGVNDEFNWKLNDHLTLKSISAYRTDHSSQDQGNYSEVITSAYGPQLFYEYQLSQEFNLINEFGPLSGVVGLYYYYDHNLYDVYAANPGGTAKTPALSAGNVSGQDTYDPTVSKAIFAEESYHITPTLKVTVGARYTQETKSLNTYNFSLVYWPGNPANNQIPTPALGFPPGYLLSPPQEIFYADQNTTFNRLTPKVGVDWQATSDILLYASITNGYKSGGYNETTRWGPTPISINAPAPPGLVFGPENMWAYEGGIKSDWLDHTLRVNLSLFRYEWYGLQFSSFIGVNTITTSNAGNAQTNGLEAAVTYKPAPGLTIDLHATVLDAKYLSFDAYSVPTNLLPLLSPAQQANVVTTSAGKVLNVTGNKLAEAPPVSLSLAVQKDFDLTNGADLFVRGEWEYEGQVYFDPTNQPLDAQAAYSILNASLGYSPANSHWTVALWGKNLANTEYIVGAQSGGSCLCAAVGDPRTFGVRINYTY